jgi:GNAT superfamily N-acetyltransferase
MTALSYRAVTSGDLPFIVGLVAADQVGGSAEAWEPGTAPRYETALRAIDADPNNELFVATLADRPVGTFQLTYLPGIMRGGMWRGLIESVHIIPDERNKGLGRQMMRWAIERCRARGCGLVQLTSNKHRLDAHRFYQMLGFEQSHEGFKLFL